MSDKSVNPLWEFSLQFYPRPGVEKHCIELQDASGADVNLILMCCWSALEGRALRFGGLAQLLSDAEPYSSWREQMIEPLRGLRRGCHHMGLEPGDSLYAALQTAELKAERVAQDYLHRWTLTGLDEAAAEPATLRHNLAVYWLGAGLGPLPVEAVEALVRAAFSEIALVTSASGNEFDNSVPE